jgi:hypothetical protein
MRILIIVIASCSLFLACRKSGASGLIGTWKLSQVYNVSQSWQNANPGQQSLLTFNSDSTYRVTMPLISSFSGCTGTYSIQDDMLLMNLSCVPDPNYRDMLMFSFEGSTLLLDHITTGAGVKTRYVRQ